MIVRPTRIRLDDVALLEELLALIEETLWVQTPYDGLASASSFVARLERVEPVNWSQRELHLSFDAARASANLAGGRMTAWRMMDPVNETYWLEFTIGERRVVQIRRIPPLRWCKR